MIKTVDMYVLVPVVNIYRTISLNEQQITFGASYIRNIVINE